MSKKASKIILFSALGLLVLIFGLAISINSSKKQEILRDGYETSGVVLNKDISETSSKVTRRNKVKKTDHIITLEYRNRAGEMMSRNAIEFVTEDIYNTINIGDTLDIVFTNDNEPYLKIALK